MVLADSSYPILNLFWSMCIFFLWVIWIWAKALWFLFVLFIPVLGVLVYLIARGGKMSERAAQQAQQQDAETRAYIQEAASSPSSSADQLTKLAGLRDHGVITAEEFEREKAKVLAA
jgi:membrane protein implicated in regulation of membrane protease activity